MPLKLDLRVKGVIVQRQWGVCRCCLRELGYARETVAKDSCRVFEAGATVFEKLERREEAERGDEMLKIPLRWTREGKGGLRKEPIANLKMFPNTEMHWKNQKLYISSFFGHVLAETLNKNNDSTQNSGIPFIRLSIGALRV